MEVEIAERQDNKENDSTRNEACHWLSIGFGVGVGVRTGHPEGFPSDLKMIASFTFFFFDFEYLLVS